jgi:hypothetical protein
MKTATIALLTSLAVFSAANAYAGERERQMAADCAIRTQGQIGPFTQCVEGHVVLPPAQMALVECASAEGRDTSSFAECAGRRVVGPQLSRDQRRAIDCAKQSDGDRERFASCLGQAVLGSELSPQQQRLFGCARRYSGRSTNYLVGCAGRELFGNNLSRDQEMAITCAANSGGSASRFGVCAATSYLNMNLNPEQQIALECVATTGGQPYAAAACTATQLTARELDKCFTDGVGGERGCFGDNNDLVGRNGWVGKRFREIAGGPNSMVNNPGQIFGGPNSVFNNPGQITGGPNSVINNPGQLLPPAPPPAEIGRIGGHRVCIPWC